MTRPAPLSDPRAVVLQVQRGGKVFGWLHDASCTFTRYRDWDDVIRELKVLGPQQWPTHLHIRRVP